MSFSDFARAWKDPEYRESLTAVDLAGLPANPAGPSDLADHDLALVSGGAEADTQDFLTLGCCSGFTSGCSYFCSWNCTPGPTFDYSCK